jgi:thymidylate synthase
MNNLDKQYQALLQDILDNGVCKQDRTGTGTISLFGKQIRHKMSEGFPLLTTKKMPFRLIATELIWFLRGDTNIKFLVDNNCHIWDGDAYKNYCNWYNQQEGFVQPPKHNIESFIERIKTDDEFAKKWGDLGPVYGKQWRSWGGKNITNYDLKNIKGSDQYKIIEAVKNGEDVTKYGVEVTYKNNSIDQIANLINDLKTNPDSRRLMVNAWNVGELDSMVLPPCHYGFQVYTRELNFYELKNQLVNSSGGWFSKTAVTVQDLQNECIERNIPTRAISLMWNQRSVDTFLGLPFNVASYGLLLEIIAKEVNMVPDELIGNLGDTHLYLDHIEQANEQVTREPYPLPKLLCLDEYWYLNDMDVSFVEKIEKFRPDFFILENYQAHPHIKAPLSN